MSTSAQQDRQNIVAQSLAIASLEGLEPSPEFRALLSRYVKGEVTTEQAIAITIKKHTANKKK